MRESMQLTKAKNMKNKGGSTNPSTPQGNAQLAGDCVAGAARWNLPVYWFESIGRLVAIYRLMDRNLSVCCIQSTDKYYYIYA